jgi:hypothetical protein
MLLPAWSRYRGRVDEIPVEILPLPEPRALTLAEREVLEFLLSGPVDSHELRAQAANAFVAGVCSCGCASVTLVVDEGAPRARLEGPEVLPAGGAEIRAVGVEEGVETGVILHIVGDVRNGDGVLWELEVWPTSAREEQVAGLPAIETLRFEPPLRLEPR